MADEAKIDIGYLSVKERKERWKAFKIIDNLKTMEGHNDSKGVILPMIVFSYKRDVQYESWVMAKTK